MTRPNALSEPKLVLVTGAAKRIGRAVALSCARAGMNVVIHYGRSKNEASHTKHEIEALGGRAWVLQADLRQPTEAVRLIERAAALGPLFALINNAAVFDVRTVEATSLSEWDHQLAVNLTAPFILTQAFARQLGNAAEGRVVNMLDWRALRPDAQHFAYSVSKAALASMTKSLALALAPRISVNGLALGAILPPSGRKRSSRVLVGVPAERWGQLREVEEAIVFLLTGPAYITGEIIHVDGGRHLT